MTQRDHWFSDETAEREWPEPEPPTASDRDGPIPDGTRPGVTCCFSGPTTGFPRIEHRQLMRVEHHSRDRLPGLIVALLAGLHKAILTSTPVNDDY